MRAYIRVIEAIHDIVGTDPDEILDVLKLVTYHFTPEPAHLRHEYEQYARHCEAIGAQPLEIKRWKLSKNDGVWGDMVYLPCAGCHEHTFFHVRLDDPLLHLCDTCKTARRGVDIKNEPAGSQPEAR